jgi:hypothetical protein
VQLKLTGHWPESLWRLGEISFNPISRPLPATFFAGEQARTGGFVGAISDAAEEFRRCLEEAGSFLTLFLAVGAALWLAPTAIVFAVVAYASDSIAAAALAGALALLFSKLWLDRLRRN